jgi:hypothetical protein
MRKRWALALAIIFENVDAKIMLKRSVSHENFRAVSTCKDSSLLFAVNAKDGVFVNTSYVIGNNESYTVCR